ncbi:MAG: CoA-binding protein [Eudoraea sp.]|nr:CoA-binding protein [Eudoraea sp.]
MKKTLVFGASTKPSRYSYIAIKRLVDGAQETLAFGVKEGSVAGVKIMTTCNSFKDIDTITLYIGPARQKEYYDTIIGLSPRRVIFNPGTENPEFYDLLKKEGIEVEVACTLVLLATGQYN